MSACIYWFCILADHICDGWKQLEVTEHRMTVVIQDRLGLLCDSDLVHFGEVIQICEPAVELLILTIPTNHFLFSKASDPNQQIKEIQ